MPDEVSGGGQGQESGTGAGAAGQGQESGQQQGSQGQESGDQGQGQQGTEGQQGGQQEQNGGADLSSMSLEDLRAFTEKLQKDAWRDRREAANYRTRATTLEQQVQEFQRQNETDQQRLEREQNERQERLDRLERENRELRVGTAIQAAATEAKAFNPVLVSNMLAEKVTLGDDGKPTNVTELLRDLRQSDPYLFKRESVDAGGSGSGGSSPAGTSMNDIIRSAVAARTTRS